MIYNTTNSISQPAFKGMSITDLKKFVPNLNDVAAQKISYQMEQMIPNDILQVSSRDENTLLHVIKTGAFKLPIGEIHYTGRETASNKLNFLYDVINRIKNNTLYKQN